MFLVWWCIFTPIIVGVVLFVVRLRVVRRVVLRVVLWVVLRGCFLTMETRVFLIPPDGAEWHNRKSVWETDHFSMYRMNLYSRIMIKLIHWLWYTYYIILDIHLSTFAPLDSWCMVFQPCTFVHWWSFQREHNCKCKALQTIFHHDTPSSHIQPCWCWTIALPNNVQSLSWIFVFK